MSESKIRSTCVKFVKQRYAKPNLKEWTTCGLIEGLTLPLDLALALT